VPQFHGNAKPLCTSTVTCGRRRLYSSNRCHTGSTGTIEGIDVASRFLLLSDVAEILNISASQTYALVRRGDLPAIQVGGRGQWRVEASQLEAYIERMYAETRRSLRQPELGDATLEAAPGGAALGGDAARGEVPQR